MSSTFSYTLSRCCSDKFHREKRYVAIKALTGYSTDLTLRSITLELAALKQLASRPSISDLMSTHCIQLLSHFIHPGKDNGDRDHLCLVTDILGGNVKYLQKSVNKAFPLPLAKRILLHTLCGIAHMHSCDIVHTDLKHDNIMFDAGSLTSDDFPALIKADPPRSQKMVHFRQLSPSHFLDLLFQRP
jgi:serine/threonine protein kinase